MNDKAGFDLAYFEQLPAGSGRALIRVGGRWFGRGERGVGNVQLVAFHDGNELTLTPLPRDDPDGLAVANGALWRGAFSIPADVAGETTRYALNPAEGGTVALPAPTHMRLAARPKRGHDVQDAVQTDRGADPRIGELESDLTDANEELERARSEVARARSEAEQLRARGVGVERESDERAADVETQARAREGELVQELEAARADAAVKADELAALRLELGEAESRIEELTLELEREVVGMATPQAEPAEEESVEAELEEPFAEEAHWDEGEVDVPPETENDSASRIAEESTAEHVSLEPEDGEDLAGETGSTETSRAIDRLAREQLGWTSRRSVRRPLRVLRSNLEPGEHVRYLANAAYERKSSLVAVTDRRLLVIVKRGAVASWRHDEIDGIVIAPRRVGRPSIHLATSTGDVLLDDVIENAVEIHDFVMACLSGVALPAGAEAEDEA